MLTENQIKFLNRVCPDKWAEENGVINVGNVDMSEMNLTEIPIQFGRVNGDFNCNSNELTTLEGAPSIVKGSFWCAFNQLITLEGGPNEVNRYYSCHYNILTNLIGAPKICNIDFSCVDNKLTSLEGCPSIIKENLNCRDNPNLHILYGLRRVEGKVLYDHVNDLNEWIIEQARKDIFSTYTDISKWIKDNNRLEFLLMAQPEIREHFSPRILHLADSGAYNESRILDYKKFSSLC